MSKGRQIFIGNLPTDITSWEVEELFQEYGSIEEVDLIMARDDPHKPPFAFVEFEDPRSAQVAIRKRNRTQFRGFSISVQFSRTARRIGGGTGSGLSLGDGIGRGSRIPPRTDYRVRVSGLPSNVSWQEFKNYLRGLGAGDVRYVDVFKNGAANVEYTHYEDMKKAVENLDGSMYPSKEGEAVKIRAREDFPGFSDMTTGSPSSRSRDRSPVTPTNQHTI